ncbi:hypothetical protein ABBQ32_004841 [Trebouxia sp. C0010 RCD-2024]
MTLVEPHTSATAYQQQSRSWEPGTSDTDLVDRFRQGLGFASRYLAFTTAHACDVVSRGLQLQCELQAPAVCRQHLYVLYRRASDGCQGCYLAAMPIAEMIPSSPDQDNRPRRLRCSSISMLPPTAVAGRTLPCPVSPAAHSMTRMEAGSSGWGSMLGHQTAPTHPPPQASLPGHSPHRTA